MMPAFVSTKMGLLKPNSSMLEAISATCASECVLGFVEYGMSLSMGQCSIRWAVGGAGIPHLVLRLRDLPQAAPVVPAWRTEPLNTDFTRVGGYCIDSTPEQIERRRGDAD